MSAGEVLSTSSLNHFTNENRLKNPEAGTYYKS